MFKRHTKNLIASCRYYDDSSAALTEALRLLDEKCNDPYRLANAYIDKLLQIPIVKSEDLESLKKLNMFVQRCAHAMYSLDEFSVLNHVPNMKSVIVKLPVFLQYRWREKAQKVRKQSNKVVFKDLAEFINSKLTSRMILLLGTLVRKQRQG